MKCKRIVLVLALTLPALGGCAGADDLDPGTAEFLQQQVRELAAVTRDGNLELAMDRAEALKANVQQAEESGAVAPARAENIQLNIDAFIESIRPADAPAPAAPSATPSAEPAPAPPAPATPAPAPAPPPAPATPAPAPAPAPDVKEDGEDPEESKPDRDREKAEKAAEEAQKRAEEAAKEAQKRAEEEEKERQKQEEGNREGGDD